MIEKLVIEIMEFGIEAQFKSSQHKLPLLETARIKNEVLKHAIRTEYEFKIVNEKEYLRLAEQTVVIAKMLNGWIKYITEKSQRP